MAKFLAKNWFLVGLIGMLGVGWGAAGVLQPIADVPGVRYAIVFGVLFCMALPLEAAALWQVVRRPAPALLASFVNMGLIPPVAWFLFGWLPTSLLGGLVVAGATPCTVASAAVWTRKAGGNDAVAIMVTVLTNVSCFVVTPLWVVILVGSAIPTISLGGMASKLLAIVLLPMTLAQMARIYSKVARFARQHKKSLGNVAQCGILAMVLIGTVKMRGYLESDPDSVPSWPAFLAMTGAVLVLHLGALFGGVQLARLLRMKRPEQIAVAFAGSQKTLLVGLSVSIELNVSILPIVVYHVGQLLVDTLIANRWADAAKS